MLTRDSLVWVLLLAVAVVGYLTTAERSPMEWGYREWLQAASFLLAWIVGKLGSSPLAGLNTPHKESYPALGGLVRIKDVEASK
jgi:hypothetical protein